MEGVELGVMVVLIDWDIDDERDVVGVGATSAFQGVSEAGWLRMRAQAIAI